MKDEKYMPNMHKNILHFISPEHHRRLLKIKFEMDCKIWRLLSRLEKKDKKEDVRL